MKFLALTMILSSFFAVEAFAQKKVNCSIAEKDVRKRANRCLKRKKFERRKKCFDQIGKRIDRRYRSCEQVLEPLKGQFMAMERQKYPKQPSALEGGGPGDQMANHGNGPHGNMGAEFKGEPMQPKEDVRKCQKVAKMVRKRGNRCLGIKNAKRRGMCFKKVGEAKHRRVQEGCKMQLGPVAQQLMAEEQKRYKTNSIGEGRGPEGPHHSVQPTKMADNQGHSLAFCQKVAKKAKRRAQKCLNRKNAKVRKNCMDKVGESVHRRVGEGCREQMEPLKNWVIAEEAKRYKTNSVANDQNHHHDGIAGNKQGDRQGHSKVMCKKVAKKAKRGAKRCLKKRNEFARKKCLDAVGESIHRRVGDGCRHDLNPIRDWVMAEEQKRYKTNSVAKDEAHHHDGLAPQTAKIDPMTCRKTASFAGSMAKSCLQKYKDHAKRQRCMDMLGKQIDKRLGGADACHAELDPVGQRYIAEEQKRYPNQPGTLNL